MRFQNERIQRHKNIDMLFSAYDTCLDIHFSSYECARHLTGYTLQQQRVRTTRDWIYTSAATNAHDT